MVRICASLTTFSWVSEGSQCFFFIIDILGKVVDSVNNYSKPWTLIHTTQML